jgi:hypothetical protein
MMWCNLGEHMAVLEVQDSEEKMTTKLDFKGETAETEHDQAVFTSQTERRTMLSRIERIVDEHMPHTKSQLRRASPVAEVPQLFRGSRAASQRKKPKKVGRPKLPKGEAKGKIVPIRFAKAEFERLSRKAEGSGKSISEWIRSTLLSDLEG